MEPAEKLLILGESAKYDVSCSSSGTDRAGIKGGIGSAAKAGICHTFTADGRCISLLKVLLTNNCIYDCAYCINRKSNDIKRAAFTPQELADITINFYKRNYIEGLFLSSGVVKNADFTMALMVRAVRILRQQHLFNGYIHIKAIPGASQEVLDEAGLLADRLSINMELPGDNGLKLLAPDKKMADITAPMGHIKEKILESKADKFSRKSFAPAGQSTQLIVGATGDTDKQIISLSENMYTGMNLKRVYYSSYIHVNNDSRLPVPVNSPLLREHRLYQADWLLRFYKFKADELLDEEHPNFDTRFDPKAAWALRHMEQFPVEINTADYEKLLRVPGIGVRSAQRIIKARRACAIGVDDLKKLGIVMKRARFFITAKGKSAFEGRFSGRVISARLLDAPKQRYEQLSLFKPEAVLLPAPEDTLKSITGEL